MKSRLIKWMIPLLILGMLVGVERLSHLLTDGFGYADITSNLPYNPAWEVPFESEDQELIESALHQTYHYLESGSQSFVFMSEDKNYVIKFFKHKRWRLNPLLTSLPLPSSLALKRENWIEKKKETVNATFGSCKTAYTEFKKETGILFLHLNKTPHFNPILTVKDRIGLKHQIPLGEVEFIIQKKAIPTPSYLLALKQEGKTKEAQKALSDLFSLTVMRAKKGYSDKDPHLIRNFGFIDGKGIELDVGGFHHDPKKDLNYFYNQELKRIHQKLIPWLERHYPELVPYAEEEMSTLSLNN
ncbi:MAG: hypothetical protein KDK76_01185 [Chlamydiia bacterium]|nr:hypothetical protein [Chlamydiia bacterium]